MKISKKLPGAPVPVQADGPPCHKCSAMCCRYFALELDEPEDAEDFDAFKWYLIHEKSWIWVDDGDWYLQVDAVCKYLGPDNACTIYDRRPQICRDYGMPEKLEDPDEPLCDYFAVEEKHDLEFHTFEELERYARKFLALKEAKRRRRSEAAKRGWRRRRSRGEGAASETGFRRSRTGAAARRH